MAFCNQAKGQTSKIQKADLGEPLDFSYMDKWVEFELRDTIDIVILEHFPASLACGVLATTSITYGLTNDQDTIRIKDLCNTSEDYHTGERIKVAPAAKPPFSVTPPWPDIDLTNRKVLHNQWDLTVKLTTWGTLIHESLK